jgi:hypothetical protein
MMGTNSLLVGLAAGLAALLLFAALLTGTAFALPLFFLAPLPIAIAGLGWGPAAGAAAAVIAAAGIAFTIGPLIAAVVFILFAAPIAWSVYLLGLSRPDGDGSARQWYPLGRVLLNMAGFVGAAIVVAGTMAAYDPTALAAAMAEALEGWMAEIDGATPTREQYEPLIRINVALLPYTTAALAMTMLVFNSWLGGRIAGASGRLQRPWTPLWTAGLPGWTAGVFIAAFLLTFVDGPLGEAAGAVTGAFGYALGLLGLAVLHVVTLGRPGRTAILVGVYAALVIFAAALVLLIPLGIAELFFRVRERRGIPVA